MREAFQNRPPPRGPQAHFVWQKIEKLDLWRWKKVRIDLNSLYMTSDQFFFEFLKNSPKNQIFWGKKVIHGRDRARAFHTPGIGMHLGVSQQVVYKVGSPNVARVGL